MKREFTSSDHNAFTFAVRLVRRLFTVICGSYTLNASINRSTLPFRNQFSTVKFQIICPKKRRIPNALSTDEQFKRGRVNLRDEFRDGRTSTAVDNKNIDAVRRAIETDRHVTYHEIRASLGMNQVQSIYTNIWVRKSCARGGFHTICLAQKTTASLVQCCAYEIRERGVKFNMGHSNRIMDLLLQPQNQNKAAINNRMGSIRDELKPAKVAHERSAFKRMIASFFNKTGHVATVLENYRTVNSDWNQLRSQRFLSPEEAVEEYDVKNKFPRSLGRRVA
ncbi:hypothetical protein EVAR_26923_1 [Eumeta japonica]|uniref:Uncharacterized protein n=1 Tax=Eumeta variegata TaxID=151549 RepID=A0A4C1VSY6_EUMVA|nr:hypothetical protein EVAR_26923_1 [Eumeta japonica]